MASSGVTREVRTMLVRAFALSGVMAETATIAHARGTMFPGGVPADLLAECERSRAALLALGEAAYGDRGAVLR